MCLDISKKYTTTGFRAFGNALAETSMHCMGSVVYGVLVMLYRQHQRKAFLSSRRHVERRHVKGRK